MLSTWFLNLGYCMTDILPAALLYRCLEQFSPLSADDRQAIESLRHRVRTHTRSPWTTRQGTPQTTCLLLLSGTACQYHVLACGSRQITSIHMAGDLIGLHHDETRIADQSLELIGTCDMVEFDRKELLALADAHPAIARAF